MQEAGIEMGDPIAVDDGRKRSICTGLKAHGLNRARHKTVVVEETERRRSGNYSVETRTSQVAKMPRMENGDVTSLTG